MKGLNKATIALGMLALLLATGCKQEEKSNEFLYIGIISLALTASSCAGGVPEVNVHNNIGRANNKYRFYTNNDCSGALLTTTEAINNGVTSAYVCVSVVAVGIRDQDGVGACTALNLFSGSKQTVTHFNDGTEKYSLAKATGLVGFGGF